MNPHEKVPCDWYNSSIKKNLIQRYVHQRRFYEVGKIIEPKRKGLVLDIGCADGTFSTVLLDKTQAGKLIGIDTVGGFINWAGRHWKKGKRIKFELGNAEKLNFKTKTFDAVFALEILEHVESPGKVLREIKRVLKDDGYAILLVPAESWLFRLIWFFWSRTRGRVWKETHIQSFKNNFLTRKCLEAGFKIDKDKKIIFKTLHLVKVRK